MSQSKKDTNLSLQNHTRERDSATIVDTVEETFALCMQAFLSKNTADEDLVQSPMPLAEAIAESSLECIWIIFHGYSYEEPFLVSHLSKYAAPT